VLAPIIVPGDHHLDPTVLAMHDDEDDDDWDFSNQFVVSIEYQFIRMCKRQETAIVDRSDILKYDLFIYFWFAK
jgi:hypothetical protein